MTEEQPRSSCGDCGGLGWIPNRHRLAPTTEVDAVPCPSCRPLTALRYLKLRD